MNRVILQLWEQSTSTNGIFSNGCSLHLSEVYRDIFITNFSKNRSETIPDEYDRVVGGEIEVFVSDSLFERIKTDKDIKLSQVEFRNLITFEDIIFNFATI